MGKLSDKTVLITGAASGMGKAMALLFAQQDAQLVLCDIQQMALKNIKKDIEALGKKVKCIVCNVSSENDCNNLFKEVLVQFNTVDVLVNNAGVMDDFLPVDKVDNSSWERVMGINLNGPFYLSRLIVPVFLKQKSGVILNIASVGGLHGSRAGAAYTASKHALIGLTKNIAFMYAQQGVRCNAIAPGGVKTNIGTNMKPDPFGYERCVSGGSNMPRMGEADEIAKTALFLVSDDSSFINGAVLTADGGWTAY